jgi:hypothetical protein
MKGNGDPVACGSFLARSLQGVRIRDGLVPIVGAERGGIFLRGGPLEMPGPGGLNVVVVADCRVRRRRGIHRRIRAGLPPRLAERNPLRWISWKAAARIFSRVASGLRFTTTVIRGPGAAWALTYQPVCTTGAAAGRRRGLESPGDGARTARGQGPGPPPAMEVGQEPRPKTTARLGPRVPSSRKGPPTAFSNHGSDPAGQLSPGLPRAAPPSSPWSRLSGQEENLISFRLRRCLTLSLYGLTGLRREPPPARRQLEAI